MNLRRLKKEWVKNGNDPDDFPLKKSAKRLPKADIEPPRRELNLDAGDCLNYLMSGGYTYATGDEAKTRPWWMYQFHYLVYKNQLQGFFNGSLSLDPKVNRVRMDDYFLKKFKYASIEGVRFEIDVANNYVDEKDLYSMGFSRQEIKSFQRSGLLAGFNKHHPVFLVLGGDDRYRSYMAELPHERLHEHAKKQMRMVADLLKNYLRERGMWLTDTGLDYDQDALSRLSRHRFKGGYSAIYSLLGADFWLADVNPPSVMNLLDSLSICVPMPYEPFVTPLKNVGLWAEEPTQIVSVGVSKRDYYTPGALESIGDDLLSELERLIVGREVAEARDEQPPELPPMIEVSPASVPNNTAKAKKAEKKERKRSDQISAAAAALLSGVTNRLPFGVNHKNKTPKRLLQHLRRPSGRGR